jgi:sporulation protein YlmC with PRC-barrel domain
MHRHILITSALLLGFTTVPALAQTEPQQPPQAVVQGQGTVEVRPAEPQIRIESAPPEVQVETPGEPAIRVVQVPTIDGRMPEEIVGRTVKNSEGEDIGEVRDFITQPDSAAIESLVLSQSRFLGIGEKLVTIPWDKVRVDPQSHELLATLTKDELDNAPEFEYSGEARTVIGPEQPEK